jgi:probable rRNA maturation factor
MPPRFAAAARAVLPGWELSLAFLSPAAARRLNRTLRGRAYTPNVLSYQVGPEHGEVIICKEVAAREAARYGHSPATHLLFLFIHALLHLKGMPHGPTMEKREYELLARYARIPGRVLKHGSTHRNRHRHRDLPGQDRRRRGDPR